MSQSQLPVKVNPPALTYLSVFSADFMGRPDHPRHFGAVVRII